MLGPFRCRLKNSVLPKFKPKYITRCKAGLVYRSVSFDPFLNLALEDWIHDCIEPRDKPGLLLWRNEPTVVIGRHQNPWKECNLEIMKSSGINLVRRKSGGGTVYHDLGNINCTFFTDRNSYDRKKNLQFLANFLRSIYGFDVSLNERDDLFLESKYKISGTAAKLSLKSAYHHCTLLCKVDTTLLDAVLIPSYFGIASNATQSLKSKTKNLFDDHQLFDWEGVTRELAKSFVMQYKDNENNYVNDYLVDIDPSTVKDSSEILKRRQEFLAWDWNYGKTPKFRFEIEEEFAFGQVKLNAVINKGVFVQIDVHCNNSMIEQIISRLTEQLVGITFDRADILATFVYFLSSSNFSTFLEENVSREVSEWITSSFH